MNNATASAQTEAPGPFGSARPVSIKVELLARQMKSLHIAVLNVRTLWDEAVQTITMHTLL